MDRKEARKIVDDLCIELIKRDQEGNAKVIGRCNRCGAAVTDETSNPDYSGYCCWHDEDLFEMEFTRYSDMFDPERGAQVFVEFMMSILDCDGFIDEDEGDAFVVREILRDEYNKVVRKHRGINKECREETSHTETDEVIRGLEHTLELIDKAGDCIYKHGKNGLACLDNLKRVVLDVKSSAQKLYDKLYPECPPEKVENLGWCNRCGTVVTNEISRPDYTAYCPEHDEDLYRVEFTAFGDPLPTQLIEVFRAKAEAINNPPKSTFFSGEDLALERVDLRDHDNLHMDGIISSDTVRELSVFPVRFNGHKVLLVAMDENKSIDLSCLDHLREECGAAVIPVLPLEGQNIRVFIDRHYPADTAEPKVEPETKPKKVFEAVDDGHFFINNPIQGEEPKDSARDNGEEEILVQFPGSAMPVKMKFSPGDRVWASNESQEDAITSDEHYRFEKKGGNLYFAKHLVTGKKKWFKYVVPAINLSYLNRETDAFVEVRANINEYGDQYERYNKTGGYRYYQCPVCKPDNHHYLNLRVSDAITDVHFLEYVWRNGHTSATSCRDGNGDMCDYIRFVKE